MMKSVIKIKVAAESWKNNGSSMFRTTTFTVPKAVKAIVKTYEDQNIVPVVSYEGEYAVITAEAA